jgi:hypothetical protein
MQQKYFLHLNNAAEELLNAAKSVLTTHSEKGLSYTARKMSLVNAIASLFNATADLIEQAQRFESEPTEAAEPAPLQDTTGTPKATHAPVTAPSEPIAVQAEPAEKAAPAPAPAPEKEVTPAPAADGEKAEKKAAPKATPPASKTAEQTAPKAKGWVEKTKTDDKLNSASQENYADKSDADLDKERRLLCRDAVLKGAQPEAVRNFSIEKFGVRTVGAIPREKHGEWVAEFKKTFGV